MNSLHRVYSSGGCLPPLSWSRPILAQAAHKTSPHQSLCERWPNLTTPVSHVSHISMVVVVLKLSFISGRLVALGPEYTDKLSRFFR